MEKLFALVSIGQNIYGRWLFLRVLSGIVVLAGLTIVASILLGAMIVGGFYAAYLTLIYYGLAPHIAALAVEGMILFVILLFVLLTVAAVRRLREMPRRLLQKKSSIVSHTDDIIDAFFDGLLGTSDKNRK